MWAYALVVFNSEICWPLFSDASTNAYGAAGYICKNNHISYISDVQEPCYSCQQHYTPQVRVDGSSCGYKVSSVCHVFQDFQCHVPPYDIHFWMDSQIILYWKYKNNNSRPFISHHGKGIAKLFSANSWSYTPSSDNPADFLIRTILIQQLISS